MHYRVSIYGAARDRRKRAGAAGLLVSGVTIRSSSSPGVLLDDSGEVRNSTFLGCSIGVASSFGVANIVVRQNSFFNCTSAISVQGKSVLVTGNTIATGSQGILVTAGTRGQILNNSVQGCSGPGIIALGEAQSGAVVTVRSNSVTGGYVGISLTGPILVLENNTVRDAWMKGIEVACETAAGSAVRDNLVLGSQTDYTLSNNDPAAGLAISGNTANGASMLGFQILGDDNAVDNNTASSCGTINTGGGFTFNGSGNTVRKNKALKNGWIGFNIDKSALVKSNTASGNAIGILVNGGANDVLSNTARANALYGIKVETTATSTTVQDNTALANIGADFCNAAGTETSASGNTFRTTGTSCS